MSKCEHNPGWDFTVVEDEKFANIYHSVYKCRDCGILIERECECRDGKVYRIWKAFELRGAA